jgi:hypothetical protein
MNFLKNPLQVRYIPVLIALIVGVMCTAVDNGVHRLVPALVWLYIAASQVFSANHSLKALPFWLYVITGAIFSAFAVLMIFVGAFLAAVFAAAIAAFPLSVVFTRSREGANVL